ncbi:hypothetical protein PAPYR_13384 [Paratrimastix pyriformis]|uniref:Uncharacterized protein n=1 Tax=Paratrimastix pyriformis TaxID=342808 RepID=A0ABQ8U2I0_9EUKA|nr:hypothetical protein PAPYR_13384 [Paratrimastix pyriformis]
MRASLGNFPPVCSLTPWVDVGVLQWRFVSCGDRPACYPPLHDGCSPVAPRQLLVPRSHTSPALVQPLPAHPLACQAWVLSCVAAPRTGQPGWLRAPSPPWVDVGVLQCVCSCGDSTACYPPLHDAATSPRSFSHSSNPLAMQPGPLPAVQRLAPANPAGARRLLV